MEDKEYYSDEINLISTHDGPLQWIVGLYQYHEQVYQPSGVRAPQQAELDPMSAAGSTVAGPPNPDRNCRSRARCWTRMRTPSSARSTMRSTTTGR